MFVDAIMRAGHGNLLHNNEVRNVTNQNTRQHLDNVCCRVSAFCFLFYHYNIFGAETFAILVHLSAATELKRLRFYCRGRVPTILRGWVTSEEMS